MTYITRLNTLLASLTVGHRTGLDPDPPSAALVESLDYGLKSVLIEIIETVEDAIGDVAGGGGGGGSIVPTTVTLGPFTIDHTDGESERVALPDNLIGIMTPVTIVVTAISFDGDLSQGLSLDVQPSWTIDGDLISSPAAGEISPLGFQTEEAPLSKTGVNPGFCGHYVNMIWGWNGAGGPDSHATFHATFDVF